MTIMNEKPDTPQEALKHYGVPGMKWGVRKADGSSRLSDGQKKALKIGAGVAVTAGVVAVGVIMAKNGKLPISALSSVGKSGIPKNYNPVKVKVPGNAKSPISTAARGAKVAARMQADRDLWKKQYSEMMKDIADQHRAESRYMNQAVPNYNPRDNPFTPEARRK